MSDDLLGELQNAVAIPGRFRLDDEKRIREAADRIEALEAQVIAALQERDDVAVAADAREKVLRDALEKIANAPAWGAPDRWETTPSEVRQLARAALKGQP